jgi:hypothetical protein
MYRQPRILSLAFDPHPRAAVVAGLQGGDFNGVRRKRAGRQAWRHPFEAGGFLVTVAASIGHSRVTDAGPNESRVELIHGGL